MLTQDWHKALYARVGGGMRYDLVGIAALLAALGSPERGLRVVSVAGTNGKGTTSYLLARALQHAGVRTGLFTSPHLVDFGERIQVQGEALGETAGAAAYARLEAVEPRLPRPFSFFEATLAMACLAFAEAGVQVAVVEAGLGGRLDATNVFAAESRLACVTTRIDLDHEAMLGGDRVAIAYEKAGLWRKGRPAVVGPQRPEVRAALGHIALERGVPVHFVKDVAAAKTAVALPATAAWPAYLRENAAIARATLKTLAAQGVPVAEAHLVEATRTFAWPGRYHRLAPAQGTGPQLLLDAGHNPGGVAALASALAADPALFWRPAWGVMGALDDKDLTRMVAALRPKLDQLALCSVGDGPRARSTEALRASFADTPVYDDVTGALAVAFERAPSDAVVVVTGSLMLVGEALAWLRKRQYVDLAAGN